MLVQSVPGLHSGVNPVSGDFSAGAEGLLHPRRRARPSRSGSSPSPRRSSACCIDVVAVGADLEWLPGSAAGVTLAIRDVSLSGA